MTKTTLSDDRWWCLTPNLTNLTALPGPAEMATTTTEDRVPGRKPKDQHDQHAFNNKMMLSIDKYTSIYTLLDC